MFVQMSTAQTETVEYGIDSSAIPKIRFIDEYDYVFMTREETKSLFKLNLIKIGHEPVLLRKGEALDTELGFSIAYEFKLSPEIALNLGTFYRYTERYVSTNFRYPTSQEVRDVPFVEWDQNTLKFDIEPRWYFNMKKRIDEKLSANNLSGNYLSAKFKINNRFNRVEFNSAKYRKYSLDFGLGARIGFQRRVFRRFYVDMSFGVDYIFGRNPGFLEGYVEKPRNAIRYENFDSFQLTTGLTFGLAWGKTSADYQPNRCDALKCFEEEYRLWKFDLISLAQIANNRFAGSLNVAYEMKIGQSTWSITPEVDLSYNLRFFDSEGNRSSKLTYLRLGLKKYYNLKRRIAKGKSGNNLSGDFWGIHTSLFGFENSFRKSGNVDDIAYFALTPVWGFQRRMFKSGFIEFVIGPNITIWDNSISGTAFNNFGISRLKIGLAL